MKKSIPARNKDPEATMNFFSKTQISYNSCFFNYTLYFLYRIY
jgi:hypothetical protein